MSNIVSGLILFHLEPSPYCTVEFENTELGPHFSGDRWTVGKPGCRGLRSDKFTPKCSLKLNTWPVLSPWPEAVNELNYLGGGPLQGPSKNTVAA